MGMAKVKDEKYLIKEEEQVQPMAEEEEEEEEELPIPIQTPKPTLINFTIPQLSNPPTTPSPSPPSMVKEMKPRNKVYLLNESKILASKSMQTEPDHGRNSTRTCMQEKIASNLLNSTGEVKSPAMIRAEEIKKSLGSYPCFVKLMVTSHVTAGYWMGLPAPFCKAFLPKKVTPFILEDESGEQFEVKLIADKMGLSAGWKKFVDGHKLLAGDVLVFQLVDTLKFKVYIVRAYDFPEADGSPNLSNLEPKTKYDNAGGEDKKDDVERVNANPKNKKRKSPRSLPVGQKMNKKIGPSWSTPNLAQPLEQSASDSELIDSETNIGSEVSASPVQFKDVKSFEDFNISVNGLCVDSELPECIRRNYYELCCSKDAFIHARLLKGLGRGLVAGIISETVNIANAMRACKLTTSRDEFAKWGKTVASFELLGMDVGFLRARARQLQSLAIESEGASVTRKYVEAKTERAQTEVEIKNLEAKIVELKKESEKFDAEIKNLKSDAESFEQRFQEEVDAPW